jgi:glycosyltransferase involved in cell wall biosynthesis
MKCAIISTYPPRECGIATFTGDLYNHMLPNEETFIVAMNDPGERYEYPEEVWLTIEQDKLRDYEKAAAYINEHADICLLQHEFNIFGGRNGIFLLSLLNRLNIPLVSTLHTVLDEPGDAEKYIITEIIRISEKTIVLSDVAAKLLYSVYNAESEKVNMIRHPVPDINISAVEARKKLGFEGRLLLMTFGLINRNKGLETVLKALPGVVKKHPDVRYLILGKTHPLIKKVFGEEYRNYLMELCHDLGIEQYVGFENRFIEAEELNYYLAATDILITPYLNKAQVSSGPLSFAMGAGSALVSTPFWHAEELLNHGRGILFDFRDYEALAESLLTLLNDRKKMESMQKKVSFFGKKITWPVIGEDYHVLLRSEVDKHISKPHPKTQKCIEYPKVSFRHLQKLTDDTGVISNAGYGFPDLNSGYHTRHNAMALMAAAMSYRKTKDPRVKGLISGYLSFLDYMQKENGRFKLKMGFDKGIDIKDATETDIGQIIWTLGYLVHYPPGNAFRELAGKMFLKTVFCSELNDVRALAPAIIGLNHFIEKYRDNHLVTERLRLYIDAFVNYFDEHSSEKWKWFSDSISPDAALLPLAMFCASEFLRDKGIRDKAVDATEFLSNIVLPGDRLSLIGNSKKFSYKGQKALFDQRPADAMNMIMLYCKAFERTRKMKYYRNIFKCYKWFFGINDLFIDLYDPVTKGCYDGLQTNGHSSDQGAESTISLIISGLEIGNVKTLYKQLKKV